MDIVEQLRKYQCPENKGCNPVVEYCQCALMDSSADKIERLREALQELVDWQNGPPLVTYADGWNKAMEKARAALKES